MNFTEFAFWPRLLIALLLIWGVRAMISPRAEVRSLYDRCALGTLSLYLLWCVGMLTFTIFLSVFALAWGLIILMFSLPRKRRRAVLGVGIPLLCLPLLYYKYRVFIARDILGLGDLGFTSLAIPAGISFYTFQKIAMLVDASKLDEWKPRFLDYLNFASFFPQVVAGPIERRSFLFPQMERFSFECSWARFNAGAPWLAIGFFYKLVLADNLSPFINVDAVGSAWAIALTTFLFGLKIYFDFCGYSLIALGLAKCLGIEITLNFRSPYWSRNIQEFWRRWHVSLSYWFRDYVYIPLGGSKTRFWAMNLLIVFGLSGVWHGAGWGFVIWGLMHGLFTVVAHYFKGERRFPWVIGWGMTVVCVFLAWLPFYETRYHVLWQKCQLLFTPSAWMIHSPMRFLSDYAGGEASMFTMFAAIALCLGAIGLEGLARWRGREDYAFASSPVVIVACVLGVIFLGGLEANDFVYFAF